MKMRALELVGQRFGKLIVKEKAGWSNDGSVVWICHCDCGKLTEVTSRHLNRKSNNVRSCGCDRVKSGSRHSCWDGYESISGNWWSSHIKYSNNCKQRSHVSLEMTKEDAWDMFIKQDKKCWFTGVELVIHNKYAVNTASLDRINNKKGYSKDNVRWVHKHINMMKRIMSDNDFIEMCNLVSQKHQASQ
jgi:hypothetical protein